MGSGRFRYMFSKDVSKDRASDSPSTNEGDPNVGRKVHTKYGRGEIVASKNFGMGERIYEIQTETGYTVHAKAHELGESNPGY